jgi:hypothetical protein
LFSFSFFLEAPRSAAFCVVVVAVIYRKSRPKASSLNWIFCSHCGAGALLLLMRAADVGRCSCWLLVRNCKLQRSKMATGQRRRQLRVLLVGGGWWVVGGGWWVVGGGWWVVGGGC